MPSDHVVKDEAAFAEAVRRAAEVAQTGTPRTVRHQADRTAYRLRLHPPRRRPRAASTAAHTQSMPSSRSRTRATAESYVADGKYFWNSGIFVLNAAHVSGGARTARAAKFSKPRASALAGAENDLGFLRLDQDRVRSVAEHFDRLRRDGEDRRRGDAADRRRLERRRLVVIAVGYRAARRQWQLRRSGDAMLEDTTGCYVHSEKSLVATIGVKDLIIVDTPDALLVADKIRAQDVSKIVATPQALEPQRAGAAPPKLPAVGLLRDAQHRAALPGQAAAREARRQAFNANAPSSLGALDRRSGHGAGGDRRDREARA